MRLISEIRQKIRLHRSKNASSVPTHADSTSALTQADEELVGNKAGDLLALRRIKAKKWQEFPPKTMEQITKPVRREVPNRGKLPSQAWKEYTTLGERLKVADWEKLFKRDSNPSSSPSDSSQVPGSLAEAKDIIRRLANK